MSIQAVAWALDQEDLPCTPTGRSCMLVLIALANRCDEVSGHCWPGAEYIAKKARCKIRSVYRFLAMLQRNNFIDIKKVRGADGRQRSNNYWLRFDRSAAPWIGKPDDLLDEETIDDEPVDDADELLTESGQTQDVVSPSDSVSPGENVQNGPSDSVSPGENTTCRVTPESPGPSDSLVTRPIMLESSVVDSSIDGLVEGGAIEPQPPSPQSPPPPPQAVAPAERPQAAVEGRKPSAFDPKQRIVEKQKLEAAEKARTCKPVFVIEGTRAWQLWQAVRGQERGPNWRGGTATPVTGNVVDGMHRRGWWFPTLFPAESTGPPSTLSDRDAAAFASELNRKSP